MDRGRRIRPRCLETPGTSYSFVFNIPYVVCTDSVRGGTESRARRSEKAWNKVLEIDYQDKYWVDRIDRTFHDTVFTATIA